MGLALERTQIEFRVFKFRVRSQVLQGFARRRSQVDVIARQRINLQRFRRAGWIGGLRRGFLIEIAQRRKPRAVRRFGQFNARQSQQRGRSARRIRITPHDGFEFLRVAASLRQRVFRGRIDGRIRRRVFRQQTVQTCAREQAGLQRALRLKLIDHVAVFFEQFLIRQRRGRKVVDFFEQFSLRLQRDDRHHRRHLGQSGQRTCLLITRERFGRLVRRREIAAEQQQHFKSPRVQLGKRLFDFFLARALSSGGERGINFKQRSVEALDAFINTGQLDVRVNIVGCRLQPLFQARFKFLPDDVRIDMRVADRVEHAVRRIHATRFFLRRCPRENLDLAQNKRWPLLRNGRSGRTRQCRHHADCHQPLVGREENSIGRDRAAAREVNRAFRKNRFGFTAAMLDGNKAHVLAAEHQRAVDDAEHML